MMTKTTESSNRDITKNEIESSLLWEAFSKTCFVPTYPKFAPVVDFYTFCERPL